MAEPLYGDITIDGKPYRIEFESWRGKDIIDFAPRASVPGGAYVMSDLGLFQPLVQTDWRHGFGFHWYSDELGYMKTVGRIDTRQDGLAMMFTQSTSSELHDAAKEGLEVFNNAVYSWGAGGLRKFAAGSWSNVYNTAAVNFALSAGNYLFFCPDGLRIQKLDTSGVITDAGLDSNASDYKWLIVHNGYVYAGKDSSNAVHYDNSETLATLQGNTSDPNRILVGLAGNQEPTLGAAVYNGNLYIRKRDGVWVIGEDRIARRTLDFSAESSSSNLRSWAIINGYLVMPLRDRILQWNGARVSDITPHKINDAFPYVTYGQFDNFVAVGDFLYITGRTNESPATESILSWDGVGWHKLADVTLIDAETISMLAYEAINNRLWYHISTSGSDSTHYIQFQDRSTFPYADFPTSGQNSLITSRLDVGFRRVLKSMSGLTVEVRNVTQSTYLTVYYQLDSDGDWIHWADIKDPGIIELDNPGGNLTVEFNHIQFRFDFVTSVAAQSPILEGYTMLFIMRPVTKFGYNFKVIAQSNYQYGMMQDSRSAVEILDDLKSVRDSAAPVELIDMQGNSRIGYITAIQEQPMYRKVEGTGDVLDIEWLFTVNWVNVF